MRLDTLAAAIGSTPERADLFAAHIAETCERYAINTPERLAAFLAQIGHESGSLKYTSELWGPTPAQTRYEGRKDLGNTQPGDGKRFKGHGLIQTTGRYNHAKTRDALADLGCPDFEADPDALAQPRWAALSAGWFWQSHGCNELADSALFEAITRRINGGLNGQADRLKRWEKAKAVLMMVADQTDPQMQTEKEPNMIPVPFIISLASSLIEAFTPLAKEKFTSVLERHVDTPEAAQIATSLIDAAKSATGIDDPLAAVVTAKADPVALTNVESNSLDKLSALTPVLDKLAALDRDAWAAEESSRDAATARAALEPNDQDTFLTRSIVLLTAGLLVGIGAMIGILAYLKVDTGTMIGLFATLAGGVATKFSTRYDHRYGSSRSSGAKDAILGQIAER